MLTRVLVLALCALSPAAAGSVTAETVTEAVPRAEVSAAALAEALRLDDLIAVLREEGQSYGAQLQAEMFPDAGGARWDNTVAAIYDETRLTSAFLETLDAELGSDPAILAEILAFYRTDLGQRVVGLEIEARKAFLDEAQEEAARVAAEDRVAARDPRVKALERFIAAGDLVEMNVAGALSGNLAYMTGLAESGATGPAAPAEELMADVWGQEDQIRADTTSWLTAYLGLAYSPLTEEQLADYTAFMESPAGLRLNAALFVAFDRAFRTVSYELGRATGLAMIGRDI